MGRIVYIVASKRCILCIQQLSHQNKIACEHSANLIVLPIANRVVSDSTRTCDIAIVVLL